MTRHHAGVLERRGVRPPPRGPAAYRARVRGHGRWVSRRTGGGQRPEPRGWARWSAAASERAWTVGIEEELMLLDPSDWAVANRIDEVLEALPPGVASHARPRHACVIELRDRPSPERRGGRPMSSRGTHPLARARRWPCRPGTAAREPQRRPHLPEMPGAQNPRRAAEGLPAHRRRAPTAPPSSRASQRSRLRASPHEAPAVHDAKRTRGSAPAPALADAVERDLEAARLQRVQRGARRAAE